MKHLSAGKEILSFCKKCNLKLAHIIVTMKDSISPGKVQCKTCHASHAYKANATTPRKTSTRSTEKNEVPVEQVWQNAMDRAKADPKPYSIREKFQVGDIIDHKKFGTGIVQSNLSAAMIEVLFKNEIKTLIHNK
jgi:DNA-directed RNA polymerase subunit M/transcription elongation factor TFIIS